MSSLLKSQLENERETYRNLKLQGRNDHVAFLVLSKVERKIQLLERRIGSEEVKKESREIVKHADFRREPYFFEKAFSRYREFYERYCRALHPRVPQIFKERFAR